MPALSSEQIQSFRDTGYLVVEDVLDDGAISAVEAEYEAILDRVLHALAAQGKISAVPEGDFAARYTAAMAEFLQRHLLEPQRPAG